MNPRALFTFVLAVIFTLASTSASPLTTRSGRCIPNFGNHAVSIINDLFEWGFPSAAQPAFGDTMVLKVSTINRPEFQIVSVGANTFTISAINAASPPALVLAVGGSFALSLIPVGLPPFSIQRFTISCTTCTPAASDGHLAGGCTFTPVSNPGLCVRQSGSLFSVPLLTPCTSDLDQRWDIWRPT